VVLRALTMCWSLRLGRSGPRRLWSQGPRMTMAAADCQGAKVIRETVPGESARNVAIVGVSSKVT
jgi:hypothetical protein